MGEVDMTAVEALHVALQQSFSPDSNVRDPAEAAIKNLKNVPGATNMLLHITEERQVMKFFCIIEVRWRWNEVNAWCTTSSIMTFLLLTLTHVTHLHSFLSSLISGPI